MSLRHSRERIPADHPLLEGLNKEDLLIAHAFHDAETMVRQFATDLLVAHDHQAAERILGLVRRLHRLPEEWLAIFEDLIAVAERGEKPPEARGPTKGPDTAG